jgi:3'(2'), 5'-bisphosphate nucleotidase
MEQRELLEELARIASGAGAIVLEVYRSDFQVVGKSDASPVTQGDVYAEQYVLRELSALTPAVPIVSEEAAATGNMPSVESPFWLVDPLDGTKEFVSRNGEFTINIALIEDGEPVLGIVLAPALGRMFGGGRSLGAFVDDNGQRRPIGCRRPPSEGLTVVASRYHGDRQTLEAHLAAHPVSHVIYTGSSLKFCKIAAGEADLYPRLGRTMEWDTAAGHAVLAAAGGSVLALDGKPLRYGKPQFINPHFIAEGLPREDSQDAIPR